MGIVHLPTAPAIFNTDGLQGELMSLLGVGIVAVGLIALLSFASKRGGIRDILQALGGVLVVLGIVGLASLVGTDAGRNLVSTIFNFG